MGLRLPPPTTMMRSLLLCSLATFALPQEPEAPTAQPVDPGPQPAETADWLQWERLGSTALSPDGRWMAWSARRNDGTGELRVRMLATEEVRRYAEGSGATFSSDGRWLAFQLGSSEAEREKDKEQKKEPRQDVLLRDLVTGEEETVEGASSFAFSEDGRHLALRRVKGRDLIVRDLTTGLDVHFGSVGGYSWCEARSLLAMTIDAEDDAGNGVRVYDAVSERLRTLDSDAADYKGLSWRDDATDLCVLRERAFEDGEDVTHVLLAWRGLDGAPRRTEFDLCEDAEGIDRRVVDRDLNWTDAGDGIYFGVKDWDDRPAALDGDAAKAKAEIAEVVEEEDDAPKPLRETLDDPAGVEVWHAADIQIIPRQKLTLGSDQRESDLCVLWLDEGEAGRVVVLEDAALRDLWPLEGDRFGLATDETPYLTEQRYSATLFDLYRVDLRTGARAPIVKRVKYRHAGDPTGRYALYVLSDQLYACDLESLASIDLTSSAPVPFINQEISALTDQKPAYGIGGWTTDGRVLLDSRYDLWAFALDGSGFTRLTHGGERALRHRRLVVDSEAEEFLDAARPFYVSLYGDLTKQSGFGRLRVDGAAFETLLLEDARAGRLIKAEDAQTFAFTRERFDDPPDVFVGGPQLADARQVTKGNAQHADFAWGHSELIDYVNDRGEPMQGALFYPAGWVAGRTYPLITYIYELRSQSLHQYDVPSERSPYSTAVFTSQGYFVLQPDITYRPQNPGVSATECVVPAVKQVLATGMVDPARVGLVGHSWGAYQTAFLVTQTDLFAAGVAGAPLTNMMSMAGSIYWNSGQSDGYIFHESQGRMDRPFWQDVDTYIANSPIFHVDRMNTPLLVAFGDKDGAVDWNQGVELYNAARLAEKQFVMLVYPGENHGLREKPNQVDYHHRVREWFDHYLKGAEAPSWITRGQTWLERTEELEDQKKD